MLLPCNLLSHRRMAFGRIALTFYIVLQSTLPSGGGSNDPSSSCFQFVLLIFFLLLLLLLAEAQVAVVFPQVTWG